MHEYWLLVWYMILIIVMLPAILGTACVHIPISLVYYYLPRLGRFSVLWKNWVPGYSMYGTCEHMVAHVFTTLGVIHHPLMYIIGWRPERQGFHMLIHVIFYWVYNVLITHAPYVVISSTLSFWHYVVISCLLLCLITIGLILLSWSLASVLPLEFDIDLDERFT